MANAALLHSLVKKKKRLKQKDNKTPEVQDCLDVPLNYGIHQYFKRFFFFFFFFFSSQSGTQKH